jgi:hypothetical protein
LSFEFFFADEIINIYYLKRHIHVGFKLPLVISTSPLVHESTLPYQVWVVFFYSLFEIISEKI